MTYHNTSIKDKFNSFFYSDPDRSIFEYNSNNGNFIFSWDKDVDAVKSPIANDQYHRIYFTGDGAPKVTDMSIATPDSASSFPYASHQLGIDKPSKPSASASSEPVKEDVIYDRVYVCCFVSSYGEVGPPSDASNMISVNDGKEAVITFSGTIPSNITKVRFFRSTSAGFRYVGEENASANISFSDTVEDSDLGENLPSEGFIKPDENMIGLISLPYGSLAGFYGNTLSISEPYLPYAWPEHYKQSFDSTIVGIAPVSAGILVLTEAEPYIVSGGHPSSVGVSKLELSHSCVSKSSVVDMGGYALYAGPDGLCAGGGASDRVVTQGVFTRAQWDNLNPETIRAERYDGIYVASYENNDGGRSTFAYDPASSSVMFFDINAEAFFSDKKDDTLFYSDGNSIHAFAKGSGYDPYIWRSKDFQTNGQPISCMKVRFTGDSVTAKIFFDGELVHTHEFLDGGSPVCRLPAKRCEHISFQLESSAIIYSVEMATSMSELS